ncbi:phosphoribosyl pyrophosphate transferase [Microbacterium phage PauloDiaboli]|nr:phosphoribosyl pyrophosphate transferase [Microbacterium phage PauloDiaboli]
MTLHFQAKVEQGFTVHSPLQPLVFPDGAVHIKGADSSQEYQYQIADVRGMSHDDLFTLAMWADAVDDREEKKVLLLPYLPGARMDRGVPTGAFVYADFIHTMIRPDQIVTLDPHSEAALQFYLDDSETSVKVFPVERIIRSRVQDPSTDSKANYTYQGVIAPDKGAHDRAAAAAHVMGNLPVYTGGKTRDFDTGKILGFHVEDELPDEGRFLIVDDICDGGGTFLALAEATGLPKERLDLWVTHGIFSKGLSGLRQHFGVVHTTNSFYAEDGDGKIAGTGFNADPDFVKVHDITAALHGEISL